MKRAFQSLGVSLGLVFATSVALPTVSFAEDINATIVAGHPPVFRWVKHASQTFIPAVNAALEGSGHTITWSEQYGGSLAKVGDELEATEEGLAEIGLVSSVFDPAKLGVQNITYFTPFVSRDVSLVAEWMDDLQTNDPVMKASWERNGLQYLGAATGIDDYLLMTNFPIETIADLKGRKIGAPGPAVNWLKGTGAVGPAEESGIFMTPTYGNTLMGLACSKPVTAAEKYKISYYAPQPRAVTEVVSFDDHDSVVGFGETGRVKLTTLTPEFFVPGFLERDEGEREAPFETYPWDGVSGVRPFHELASSTTVGVY